MGERSVDHGAHRAGSREQAESSSACASSARRSPGASELHRVKPTTAAVPSPARSLAVCRSRVRSAQLLAQPERAQVSARRAVASVEMRAPLGPRGRRIRQPAWAPWQLARLARIVVAQSEELQTHIRAMRCGGQDRQAVVERCGGVLDRSSRATKRLEIASRALPADSRRSDLCRTELEETAKRAGTASASARDALC